MELILLLSAILQVVQPSWPSSSFCLLQTQKEYWQLQVMQHMHSTHTGTSSQYPPPSILPEILPGIGRCGVLRIAPHPTAVYHPIGGPGR